MYSQCKELAKADNHTINVSSDDTDSAVELEATRLEWRNEQPFARGIQAWEKLRNTHLEKIPLSKSTRLLDVASSLGASLAPEKRHTELFEQDFTTHGEKGDLKCPFTKTIQRRRSQADASSQRRPHSLPTPPDNKEQVRRDPIAVEFHADDLSPPPSVTGSASKCPIRYLDDHSPEEIAKYFENHKHEIPRSHEVCVKRYQSNSESIRQLDAKYGNLVSMIQGLGMKHQPMLPTNADIDTLAADKKSIEKVEKWAENCVDGAGSGTAEDAGMESRSEPRTGHFDRPLKEIRLGESPSRPWGIQVPYTEHLVLSADPQEAISNAAEIIAVAPGETPSIHGSLKEAKRCPFGHGVVRGHTSPNESQPTASPEPEPTDDHDMEVKASAPQSGEPLRLVFNGPVFFGYTADQASALLSSIQRQPS